MALLKLICALPNPGCKGAPRGLFYPDTPEGHRQAEEFKRSQDRPGWGVFSSQCKFKEGTGTLENFNDILILNGWGE